MNYMDLYNLWLESAALDAGQKAELEGIKDNSKEIEDRFYRDLSFGTAGLRGILGMGTNRMNVFTVRRAAAALGDVLLKEGRSAGGVAIAYDSRHFSDVFALDSARVLAGRGIKVYLFESLRPTPELSFTIKHLGCSAGIVITASHNPAEYNGFKAYAADGAQITEGMADAVFNRMQELSPLEIAMADESEARSLGLIRTIGADVDEKYIEHVLSLRPDKELLSRTGVKLKIVYTPLHGAGNKLVREALKRAGYTDVTVVKEQEEPDGAFPTVAYPNPELPDALKLAAEYATKKDADIVVGTDPDSDRLGMMLKKDGKWVSLTGNQVGCLMLEYILRAKKPENGSYAVSTIVSTRMIDAIAAKHGIDIIRVLTGFKYIGETIDKKEGIGNHGFLLGFEESCGYLTGGFIRDKDAVIASLLACELAAYYKSKGMTLFDALEGMYREYGYYAEKTISVTMPGIDGMEKREKALSDLRLNPPKEIGGKNIIASYDLKNGGVMGLPASNVLLYTLEDSAWVCVRPSGTEPKLKIYAGVKEAGEEKAQGALSKLCEFSKAFM